MIQTKYFKPDTHIENLISTLYYANLIKLRDTVSCACDEYFHSLNYPKVDLYMITRGVSSPTGKGSDSLPVPLTFGEKEVYLVDSAQFGMEPLVQSSFEGVYCYLPSFRGENADVRHLNQFYHCEAEIRGNLTQNVQVAENLVKHIINKVVDESQKYPKLFTQDVRVFEKIAQKKFMQVTFDEVVEILAKNNLKHLVSDKPFGRVLSSEGEIVVGRLLGESLYPVWITHYDRDTVPFYQQPDPSNTEKTLNADLVFPSIKGGFGGEILGAGQRQKKAEGILESMKRQDVHEEKAYDWYIKMRKNKNYRETSGFGLGIERLLAWLLSLENIADAAIYPVINTINVTY